MFTNIAIVLNIKVPIILLRYFNRVPFDGRLDLQRAMQIFTFLRI